MEIWTRAGEGQTVVGSVEEERRPNSREKEGTNENKRRRGEERRRRRRKDGRKEKRIEGIMRVGGGRGEEREKREAA